MKTRVDGQPLLSVVMPVFNPPPELLSRAIQSVITQVYQEWELCLADDASTVEAPAQLLEDWAARDQRIKIVLRERNGGISAATNSAAELATGEFLLFMDNDDELGPEALAEVAVYLSSHPDTDVLYTDEDKIDIEGRRSDMQIKPDWSPEMLLSRMYVGHLLIVRASLFRQVGGLRGAFDGSQDHDLALRTTELAREVGHIPKVLYHWRAIPSSMALNADSKPEAFQASRAAIQEALARRGIQAPVFRPGWAVAGGSPFYNPRFSDHGPRIAILIPTRNQAGPLRACIESLAKTTYADFEIVIIDNGSDEPDALRYIAASPHRVLRTPSLDGGLRFAEVINKAVQQIECDSVLLLGNDTEVIAPEWLSQMAGYLGIPGVGAVGPRLLFPNGRVQHGGAVDWPGEGRPLYQLAPPDDSGFLVYSMTVRNYTAVTAACMLTSKELFVRLGGFRADGSSPGSIEFDYCNRLREAGYRIVYCPSAQLIHRAGYHRGFEEDRSALDDFWARYGAYCGDARGASAISDSDMEVDPRALGGGLPGFGLGAPDGATIQILWDAGGDFSEANSVKTPFIPDGTARRLRFDLPPGAQGRLRLDPGSGFLHGELECAALYRMGGEGAAESGSAEGDCIARWSADAGFAGVTPANGVMAIPSRSTYKFMCLGPDPQLWFDVTLPPAVPPAAYVLELTISLRSDFHAGPTELGLLANTRVELSRSAGHEQEQRLQAEARLLKAVERIETLEASLSETSGALSRTESELRRVKATRGWRLLGLYGKVKHWLLRRLGSSSRAR